MKRLSFEKMTSIEGGGCNFATTMVLGAWGTGIGAVLGIASMGLGIVAGLAATAIVYAVCEADL